MVTAQSLLRDTESLSPVARKRQLVALSRRLRQSEPGSATAIVAELSRGDGQARWVAVLVADTCGQVEYLSRAVHDEIPWVATAAVLAGNVPEEALLEVLVGGSQAMRAVVRRRLRRSGGADLASRAIATVRDRWGDAEAAALLPACRPETVAELLPELDHAVGSWTPLAARHPDVLAQFAAAELDARGDHQAQQWWWQRESLIRALLRVRPVAVLDHAERRLVGPLPPVLATGLATLLRVDPERVVSLLLAEPGRARQLRHNPLSVRAGQRLATVPNPLLGTLLRATDGDPATVRRVLRAVPPSRRSQLFDLARPGDAEPPRTIPDDQLALLPWRRRHQEARRLLTLPEVAQDPSYRWRLTAFLPHQEAVPVLETVVSSADADDRASGYQLLVRNAASSADQARVARLLDWLGRVRNEREPVRRAVLTAVSQLPPELITARALPALDRLVRDALDARDTSPETTAGASRLAFRLLWWSAGLPTGHQDAAPLADWALTTMERLGTWHTRAQLPDPRSAGMLRHGQEHVLWRYLRGPLRRAMDRGDAWPLLRIALLLGRRGWRMPELQELLGVATLINDDAVIRTAIALWLAPPETRADRVGQLVAVDASVVTIPAVLDTLVTSRTDLLDRHLLGERRSSRRGRSGPRLTGRFAPQGIWVPDVRAAVQRRWTPEQRRRYRALLRIGLMDRGAARWDRARCARILAGSPDARPEDYQEALTSDDTLLVEAVLTGLGGTDHPMTALTVLLEYTASDRARVAIEAAARCARWVPPERIGEPLEDLLRRSPKISVRKEAARLIAELRPPGALDMLLDTVEELEIHRDVRIALVGRLGAFGDDPRLTRALSAAAADPDEHVAAAVLGTQWQRVPPGARPQRAALVDAVAAHSHGATASRALRMLPEWSRWLPDLTGTLRRALTDLDRLDTWRAAASAAADPAVWASAPGVLTGVAAAMLDRSRDAVDPGPDRDLPALRRLNGLVEAVCRHPAQVQAFPEAAQALAELLAGRGQPVLAARLHLLGVTPGAAALPLLSRAARLLADRPVGAWRAMGWLPEGDWATPESVPVATALADAGDTATGLLAVAVVSAAGTPSAWAAPWRDLLHRLRDHDEPDVRDAAVAVVTAPE